MDKFEYHHEYITAQREEGTGEYGFFGLGEERTQYIYAWDSIDERLCTLGEEGWELVHSEAHWIWSTSTHGAPLWAIMLNDKRRRVEAVTSQPEYIAGWYCTFCRRKELGVSPTPPYRPYAALIKEAADSRELHYQKKKRPSDDAPTLSELPPALQVSAIAQGWYGVILLDAGPWMQAMKVTRILVEFSGGDEAAGMAMFRATTEGNHPVVFKTMNRNEAEAAKSKLVEAGATAKVIEGGSSKGQ
ncbi:MAG: hypothetical protein Q7R34_13635 [Dehalococcoidia bacterium]|nr:hypothetical protein [Dehalococcoidia bacterium]